MCREGRLSHAVPAAERVRVATCEAAGTAVCHRSVWLGLLCQILRGAAAERTLSSATDRTEEDKEMPTSVSRMLAVVGGTGATGCGSRCT